MEYAIISFGGKQYIAEKGNSLPVEKIDAEEGKTVVFDQVVLHAKDGKLQVGTPFLADLVVEGTVKTQFHDKKKVGIRYMSGRFRRKFGHRQAKTMVEITEIKTKEVKKAAKKETAE